MLVWDHDNARDIAWLTVEKDIKVDPDALQFRDANLPLQVLEEEGQEVIVIDESRDRSSENWLKRNGQQEALTNLPRLQFGAKGAKAFPSVWILKKEVSEKLTLVKLAYGH